MAIFKNTTLHPVKIMVNGKRKTIRPGTVVHGPESLQSIPGLSLIDKGMKTIIPNKVRNPKVDAPKKISSYVSEAPKFSDRGETDITAAVVDEMAHLEEFRSLGRNPSVTIAILTKDSMNLIKDCCESILKNVKYKNLTVLIADTGTKNPAVFDYYRSVKDRCKKAGIGYKLVQLNSFHFSKNYNEIINRHVTTDYVLIQNNDTIALNDYVTKMMQLATIRKVGSVGCRMFYPNQRIQHDGQLIFGRGGQIINPGHLHLGALKNQLNPKEHRSTLVDGNTAAGVLMKTSDFKSVGGFDEQYADIFQDVDLMVKVTNQLGKFNYCNRNAEIVHIDNASRFSRGADPVRIRQMYQDTAYLKDNINQKRWKHINPKNYDVSIVTLVNDISEYMNLTNSLKKQEGSHKVEIIAIPNFHNQYTSIPEAFNNALDICTGRYVILMHQDVIVPPNWLNKIRLQIQQLDVERTKWGVLGPAGVTLDHSPHYYLLDKSMKATHNNPRPKQEVFCLDELCLILQKSNDLRFSQNKIDGFHFYGGDICVQSMKKGLKNYAIDAYCFHNSYDGRKNLMTKKSYEDFVGQAKKFAIMCRENGVTQWRTTTALGMNDKILFYLNPPDYEGEGYYITTVR